MVQYYVSLLINKANDTQTLASWLVRFWWHGHPRYQLLLWLLLWLWCWGNQSFLAGKKITICSGRKLSWKEHLTKTVWMENVRIQKITQETKCWNAAQSQRAPACDFISFRTPIISFIDPHGIVDMKIPMVILTCSFTKHCNRKLKLWGFKDVPTITFISHMPGFWRYVWSLILFYSAMVTPATRTKNDIKSTHV